MNGITTTDLEVPSTSLGRTMPLRIVAPAQPHAELALIILLHGAEADYRSWTSETDIATLAAQGAVLVFPDGAYSSGGSAYYLDDWQHHLLDELLPLVHQRWPQTTTSAARTAIVGISRGGYAAVNIALKHPDTFHTTAGLSAALDLAERRFRLQAPAQSLQYQSAFGAPGSDTRRNNDPFVLIDRVPPDRAPYLWLTCGRNDSLRVVNERFYIHLTARNLQHDSRIVPGDHSWNFWRSQLPALRAMLVERLALAPASGNS